MTIYELISKSNLLKENFNQNMQLHNNSYNILINQLLILSQENLGILPNEFILSDNKDILIDKKMIKKFFKDMELKIDSINTNVTKSMLILGDTPYTIYVNEFYRLYYVKLAF